MAITLIINDVSQTVENGASVRVSPSDRIQILVNGLVIDPREIERSVEVPDVILTLPDGQTVRFVGFVDQTGEAGGGLVDGDGEIAVASTLEGLTAPAGGGDDGGPDTAGDNNLSAFNQVAPGELGSEFGGDDGVAGDEGTGGDDGGGEEAGAAALPGGPDGEDPNELLSTLINGAGAAAANLPPSALPDDSAIVEDAAPNIAIGNVLTNDVDTDGPNPLTVTAVSFGAVAGAIGTPLAGAFGSLTLNADGSYSYALDNALPAVQALGQGEQAQEIFTYQSFDGVDVSTSTLTVTITGANDAPTVVADVDGVIEGAVPNTATGNVLANDGDIDGPNPLAVSAVSFGGVVGAVGVPLAGAFGSLTLNSDGSYVYTLNNALPTVQALAVGQQVQEIFTYLAFDGVAATPSTLTVTVTGANNAPTVVADVEALVEDAVPNTATGNVLVNDSDVDGPTPLTVSTVSFGGAAGVVGAPLAGAFGSLTLNADGSYTYTLNNGLATVQALAQGEQAQEVFTYQAFDGVNATASTLTVTISGINDAPVVVADTDGIVEGAVPNTTSGNVLTNDSDVDGPNALTVSAVGIGGNAGVVGAPVAGAFGSLTLNGDGSYTYTLDNALPAVQALAQGQQVQEVFTYQAFDGLAATPSTLTITVTGANNAPIVVADSDAVTEDTVPTTATGNVLSNDSDVDGPNALTVSAVGFGGNAGVVGAAVAGNFGSLTLNGDGLYSYTLDNSLPAVQALAQGQQVQDVFTYQAFDGIDATASTLTITVTGVNDAPVAVADTGAVTEDAVPNTATGNVLANDSDVDGPNTLTVSAVGFGGNAGVVGAAVAGAFGSLTLNGDGSYTYTLDNSLQAVQNLAPGQQVQEVFTYEAFDGLIATVSTLSITVTGANDAPTVVADTNAVVEDSVPNTATGNVLTNDSDIDGPNALTVSAVGFGGNAGVVGAAVAGNFGSLTLNGDGAYTYTLNNALPTVQALGQGVQAQEVFTYEAFDGVDATASTLTITITGVNDPPVAAADAVTITEAEVETSTAAPDFNLFADNGGGVDSDPDGDAFTITAVGPIAVNGLVAAGVNVTNVSAFSAGPPFAATITVDNGASTAILTVNGDGTANLTAGAGDPFAGLGTTESGTISFDYTISDTLATGTATATITVMGSNDAPVATADTFTTDEDAVEAGGNIVGNLLTNDTDIDGDALVVDSVTSTGGDFNSGLTFANLPAGLTITNIVVNATPTAPAVYEATITTSGGTAILTVSNTGSVELSGSGGTDPFGPLDNGDMPTVGFTYAVSDGTVTSTSTATIQIDGAPAIPTNVFFIDDLGGNGGTGTTMDPFQSIAAFNAANGTVGGPGADAIVYLRDGTYNETTGINLMDGQTLIGQGQDLVVNGNTIETGGAAMTPTISVAGGADDAIDLAANNTVRGLDIGNTGASSGISDNGSVGNLTISDVSITGTGQAIEIDNGGVLNVTLDSVSVGAGATNGIALANTTGSFAVTGTGTQDGSGGTITGTTDDAIIVTNATGVSISNMIITNAGDEGIAFANVTGQVMILNNTITGSTNDAIRFSSLNTAGDTFNGIFNATISNNEIGTQGVASSGSANGRGLAIDMNDPIDAAILISNNQIVGVGQVNTDPNNPTSFAEALFVRGRLGGGTTDVTITGNTIEALGGSGLFISADAGGTGASHTVTANVANNNISGGAPISFGVAGFVFGGGDILVQEVQNGNPGSGILRVEGTAANAAAQLQAGNTTGGNVFEIDDNGMTGATNAAIVAPGTTETPLTAAQGAIAGSAVALTDEELDGIVTAAKALWLETGLDPWDQLLLEAATFEIGDRGDDTLGGTFVTRVVIDDDAAGHGWFVDPTPLENSEYEPSASESELTASEGAAAEGIDLLTVVAHELGHVLGHDHEDDGVMAETLDIGIRRLPEESEHVAMETVLVAEDLLVPDLEVAEVAGTGQTTASALPAAPSASPPGVDPIGLASEIVASQDPTIEASEVTIVA